MTGSQYWVSEFQIVQYIFFIFCITYCLYHVVLSHLPTAFCLLYCHLCLMQRFLLAMMSNIFYAEHYQVVLDGEKQEEITNLTFRNIKSRSCKCSHEQEQKTCIRNVISLGSQKECQ